MSVAHLEIDSHVIRQLGDQLITDAEQALLELLKNSYDADARWVKVTINPDVATDYGIGSIVVEDNGDGMDRAAIDNGWLRVSFSLKRPDVGSLKSKTAEQRTPLGDKGLGRLGTMRLGRAVEIETYAKGLKSGHKLLLDWNAFVPGVPVSKIEIPVEPATEPPKSGKGTTLTVKGLCDPVYWKGQERRDHLRYRFSRLLSPFRQFQNFKVVLVSDGQKVDLEHLAEDVRNTSTARFYAHWDGKNLTCRATLKLSMFKTDQNQDDFATFVERDKGKRFAAFVTELTTVRPYSVELSANAGWFLQSQWTRNSKEIAKSYDAGQVDANGSDSTATASAAQINDLGSQLADPGPFECEIDSFDLGTATSETKKIFSDFQEYRDYVKRHAGIAVYRDGFEIRMPEDWLGLGKEWTSGRSYYGLKPNNAIGFVGITGEHNSLLVEKSDREGFVDTAASRMFRAIMLTFVGFCNDLQRTLRRGVGLYIQQRHAEKANLPPEWKPKDAVKELAALANAARKKRAAMESADTARRDKVKNVQRAIAGIVGAPTVPSQIRKQAQRALDDVEKALLDWEDKRNELLTILGDAEQEQQLAQAILERFEYMREQTEEVYETVGIGLVAQAIAHDMNSILEDLSARTTKVLRQAGTKVPPYLVAYTESVRAIVALLRKQVAFLEPMLRRGRENRQQFSIGRFTREFAELRTERFQANSIMMAVQVGADFSVRMNQGRLLQVLENLVRNSEYWLKENRAKKRVVRLEIESPLLIISDNGPGVKPSIEDAIFELFVSDKPDRAGSGLGLFICRQLLEAEGCSITLDDERNGDGRRFKFLVNLGGVSVEK